VKEETESAAPYTVHRSREQMVRDVRDGLSQPRKKLSPKYFYDERGSELFEQITDLPEYYLTRAERGLLGAKIPEIIDDVVPRSLVELGAGSASKTRVILDTMIARGSAKSYVPIDVSADFLETTATALRGDYPKIEITPVVSDITEPFVLPPLAAPMLVAFLGSTIGNFPRPAAVSLLSYVATLMKPGDAFLLGADLRKDPAVLNAAYNDSRGVTAAFNLNVLDRLNRELGADFVLDQFRHHAYYSSEHHRIEMHLVAQSVMTVTIPAIGEVRFSEGESIRTELSYKYDRDTLEGILSDSGMRLSKWIPDTNDVFALALARAAS
jgi:L-histidine N-alpha-methyltransferase